VDGPFVTKKIQTTVRGQKGHITHMPKPQFNATY